MASGIGLKKGDKVVVSLWEHHSNLLPWIRVKNKFGIDLEAVKPNPISDEENNALLLVDAAQSVPHIVN